MAPLRLAVVLSFVRLALGTAARGGGGASVVSAAVRDPSACNTLSASPAASTNSKRRQPVHVGGEATRVPATRSAGEPFRQRRQRERPTSRGFLSTLVEAVAIVKDRMGARAQNALKEVRAGRELFGSVLREHIPGPAACTRRRGVPAHPLAFGNFLKPAEQVETVEAVSPEMLALQAENDASVRAVLAVIDSEGWEHVTKKYGVTVVRKFLPPPRTSSAGGGVVDVKKAAKFACVKAMGTLDADASEVYKLFLDNERVHEYNDNCREVRDVERLSADTKVSWAATPRYGPFKARDFVTVVHYRTLEDGTMVVINRPVEHKTARRGKKYVRAEILIATNIMRPNPEDPAKTDFISVTHINPGGIVDSKLGAKIVNKLCAKAPVNLLVALEKAANSPPVPRAVKRAA